MNYELNLRKPLPLMKSNPILEKSFSFAVHSIHIYKKLCRSKEYIISKQFLKSATSIGANINEAISAESKRDFIHKLSIGLKEARESYYWLRLLKAGHILPNSDIFDLEQKNLEIIRILTAIIKSSRKNLNKRQT